MELFTWLWAYDKRLLCGIKYGSHSFVYIWLIPVIVTAPVLCFSAFQQIVADSNDLDECLHKSNNTEVKQTAHLLQTLMLIQEGILISVFFAALLSLIVADRIFKSQLKNAIPQTFSAKTLHKVDKSADLESGATKDREQQQIIVTKKNTAYDFQLRYDSTRSVPAKALLVLALVNYAFSFAFNDGYASYLEASAAHWKGSEEAACVIPGSFALANYSFFLVMGSGSLTLGYIALSFLFKLSHLLCLLICPMLVVCTKKRHHKIPRDFSNFANEFDFDCDEEPPCWNYQDTKNELAIAHQAGADHADNEEFKSVELPPPNLDLERSDSVRRFEDQDCLAR